MVPSQENYAKSGFQCWPDFIMALSVVISFLMQATRATLGGLPAASSRWYCALIFGLLCEADMMAIKSMVRTRVRPARMRW